MSDLRKNLQREMDSRGWNAYELSEASGVPQPTIQRFLSGKHGEPRGTTVKKLASGLSTTEAKLRGFIGQATNQEQAQPITVVMGSNAHETRQLGEFSKIPVVGSAQLGDNGHWSELEYPVGNGDGYITFPTTDKNAYALRCVGDSMKPRIKDSEFVIVEPNTEIQPGEEVLIKTLDGRVMVKTFLYKKEDRIHLISINEAHPPQSIPLNEIDKIHAVVATARKTKWRSE